MPSGEKSQVILVTMSELDVQLHSFERVARFRFVVIWWRYGMYLTLYFVSICSFVGVAYHRLIVPTLRSTSDEICYFRRPTCLNICGTRLRFLYHSRRRSGTRFCSAIAARISRGRGTRSNWWTRPRITSITTRRGVLCANIVQTCLFFTPAI